MVNVRNLRFSYRNDREILGKIRFDADEGQRIAVLGNNGAGKSTLIKCLNRILRPCGGTVRVNGADVRMMKSNDVARLMAYVAQHNTAEQFTVFDTVLLGRKPYIKFEPNSADIEIVETVLRRCGLEKYALRYIDELSGGERQKVMLARALVQQPRVLLLDEPTSSLDLRNQYEVFEMVREISRRDKMAVIIVIHDLNLALRYCDRFMLIKDGGIFAYGGIDVMTPENIGSVYGVSVAIENVRGVAVVVPLITTD
ncbi:MAG: ABC transporter ATP-binding protein [Spirochaetaceae bacterium]|jgi:iron complex transport system ATP-binding protein|nr:ABC transporter ATP-binding protein [Spirochaetaceae bacterium]